MKDKICKFCGFQVSRLAHKSGFCWDCYKIFNNPIKKYRHSHSLKTIVRRMFGDNTTSGQSKYDLIHHKENPNDFTKKRKAYTDQYHADRLKIIEIAQIINSHMTPNQQSPSFKKLTAGQRYKKIIMDLFDVSTY